MFFPGLAIVLTALGFNLLGDGLRTVLDPQQARTGTLLMLEIRDLRVHIGGHEIIHIDELDARARHHVWGWSASRDRARR